MQQGSPTFGDPFPADQPPHQSPGRVRELALTILALILLFTIAFMQRPGKPDPREIADLRAGITVQPVGVSPLVGVGKALLWAKGQGLLDQFPMLVSTQSASTPAPAPAPADPNDPHPAPSPLADYADQYAFSAADRFRAAILAGELDGWQAREARFKLLEEKLAEDSILRKDIQTVRALAWPDNRESPPDETPTEADKADLETRHGWFARWITTRGNPASERELEIQTAADGQRLLVTIFLFGLVVLAAITAGFVILIVALVQFLTGKLRPAFHPTPPELGPDRALWLETFIVFLVGFLGIKGVAFLLERSLGPAAWQGALALGLQWSLALLVFWPLLRGMSLQRFQGEIGWHRGRGIPAEIRAGILGYLAALPIYFLMALAVTLVMLISQSLRAARTAGSPAAPEDLPLPDNKVFELVSDAGGLGLLLVASLIVIWAPLVEESIFRGALYRHFRNRFRGLVGIAAAILLVAAAFAFLHPYILVGVIMVSTLGAIFALLREWRGSLIAPVTAHFLHNGAILILLLSLLPALRG